MKAARIVAIEVVSPPGLRVPAEAFAYGRKSGRPLVMGDTVTEDDGEIVVLTSTTGALIPAGRISVVIP